MSNKNFVVKNGLTVGEFDIVDNNGNVTANSFFYSDGTSPGWTYQLDDISGLFNGIRTSFPLTVNNSAIVPNNLNQLQIYIGNIPIFPTQYLIDFLNLSPLYTFKSGFYLTENRITFATAPANGMPFWGLFGNNNDDMPQFITKQTPYSAINITFGY